MSVDHSADISAQRASLVRGQQTLAVVRPCRVGDGILSLSAQQQAHYRGLANQNEKQIDFFIPASGAGSRMFSFLYDYLQFQDPESTQQAERFLSRLEEFALFRRLPHQFQQAYHDGSLDLPTLINVLLEADGLNYGQAPKGLIPFHIHEPFILNPFQEHLVQANRLKIGPLKYHFTIQQDHKEAVQEAIHQIAVLSSQHYNVRYSTQDPTTDAFVFDTQLEVCFDQNSNPLRRPSGHGTLLRNVEDLKAEYILVRNIDNVQHFSQMHVANETWEWLVGLQMDIRQTLLNLSTANDFTGFLEWNERFGLFENSALTNGQSDWQNLIQRPLRVCGMVRNDGQPGGGPFFVEKNGNVSKQIVEKAQLVNHPAASSLLLKSSHFNPVFMVLSPCDLHGNPHKLNDFKDPDTYFVVDKTQQGKRIKYIEQPGLWNGAMANWNTLFVEIPSSAFSPVKTVLDLLEKAHLPN